MEVFDISIPALQDHVALGENNFLFENMTENLWNLIITNDQLLRLFEKKENETYEIWRKLTCYIESTYEILPWYIKITEASQTVHTPVNHKSI